MTDNKLLRWSFRHCDSSNINCLNISALVKYFCAFLVRSYVCICQLLTFSRGQWTVGFPLEYHVQGQNYHDVDETVQWKVNAFMAYINMTRHLYWRSSLVLLLRWWWGFSCYINNIPLWSCKTIPVKCHHRHHYNTLININLWTVNLLLLFCSS